MKLGMSQFAGGGESTENILSEEKRAQIKKTRAESDKKLLAGGAKVISTGEQIIINPTPEQQNQISREYEGKKNSGIDNESGQKAGSHKTFDNMDNPQAQRLFTFLEEEAFLIQQSDGRYHIDTDKLTSDKFKNKLYHTNLGKFEDGKTITGSLNRIVELLGGLNVTQVTTNSADEKLADVMDGLFQKQNENSRDKVVSILKKEGIIEYKGDLVVVDVDALQNRAFWKKQTGKYITKDMDTNTRIIFNPKQMYNIIGDIQIISKDDYAIALEKGEQPKTKALCNVPENIDDAFDVETIKQKNYYVDLWDMYSNVPWSQLHIRTKDDMQINILELYLVTKVFRDLKGHRNEAGELLIFDETKDDFVKISATKLRELNIIKLKGLGIARMLRDHFPHILDKQLIKFNDFEIVTSQNISGEITRKEKKAPNPDKIFEPEFDSMKYYIGHGTFIYDGDRIPLANLKIVVLDGDKLGIVRINDGREELVYTIDRATDNERESIRDDIKKKRGGSSNKKITQHSRFGKKQMNNRIHEYNLTDIVSRRIGEDSIQYADRLQRLPDYKYIQKVTQNLSVKAGVGIHNLSWREQMQIAQINYESGFVEQDEKFINFAKLYGLNGLRAFLSIEHGGAEMGERILQIGEQLMQNSEVADKLFAQYAQIVDSVDEYVEELTNMYSEIFFGKTVDVDKVKRTMLKESAGLLYYANKGLYITQNEDKAELIDTLINDLNKQKLVQKKAINQLKETAEQLNELYKKINHEFIGEDGIGSFEALEASVATGEIEVSHFIQVDDERYKKYDSVRLQQMIEGYKMNLTVSDEQLVILRQMETLLGVQQALEQQLDRFVHGETINSSKSNENLPTKMFNKYQELVEQAQKNKLELQILFVDDDVELSDEDVDAILDAVLTKAQNLLDDYVAQVTSGQEIDEDKILNKLNNLEANLVLKLGVIKSLSGKIKPEELKGLRLNVETAEDLLVENKDFFDIQKNTTSEGNSQIAQMISMYEDNWSQYSASVRQVLIEGYLNKIKTAGDKTKIYKYEEVDNLLTFLRIDDIRKELKYFASFNARDGVKGGKIGDALLSYVLEKEGKDSDIIAVCVPQEDVLAWYVNSHNFVVNGIDLDYEGTGQAFAKIERKKGGNKSQYKDYTNEKIREKYKNNEYEDGKKYIILKYNIGKEADDESDEMNNTIKTLTDKKYIISKCAIDKKNTESKDIYLCFEKK